VVIFCKFAYFSKFEAHRIMVRDQYFHRSVDKNLFLFCFCALPSIERNVVYEAIK